MIYTYLIFHLGTQFENQVIVYIYRFNRYNNNNNTLAAIFRTAMSSLRCCMNGIAGNFGKHFKAAPQLTLHILHCNLMMISLKAKHAATFLKQSIFFNYSFVMSDCYFNLHTNKKYCATFLIPTIYKIHAGSMELHESK